MLFSVKSYFSSISLIQLLGVFTLICYTNTLFAQDEMQNNTFDHTIERIMKSPIKNYDEIEDAFKLYKNDSIKMHYLYEKSSENNYLEVQSYALNMLGIYNRNISNYNESLNLHIDALNLAKEANNLDLEVISHNMLGVVYRRLDLIRAALDYHKQALDLAESIENPKPSLQYSIAVSQNSMGNIYLVLKQYDMALRLFQKSVVIETKLDNKLGLAINYQNMGFALEQKGMLDDALSNYEKSLAYNEEINSDVGRVICFNSIGTIYIKKKLYQHALGLVGQALDKALEIGDQFYVASSYNNLGWAQLNIDDLERAQINLEKALNISREYKFKTNEIDALKHLSELYSKTGNYKLAFEYFKRSQNLEALLTNDRNLQYVNDLILQYENEKKNSKINALASENEIVKLKLSQGRKLYIIGLGSLLLLLTVLYFLYRQRKLKDEKKIITLEQDMLRSQMNPHFIFNALNSIKLYIVNNEKENAVYYLNKFSKLIRKTLIASTEKNTSLKDELDTMQLYINIENIRFSNEINYSVHVEDNIDIQSIKVPSLILQPFLENALWHGLSTKAGEKNISINVSRNNPRSITINIIDNGIGRDASAEIKAKKSLNRKSVGISLTKERLENFSKQFTSNYKLEIIDLFENGTPKGTEVILNIPSEKLILKTA